MKTSLVLIAGIAIGGFLHFNSTALAQAVTPGTVIGNKECITCHEAERKVWEGTKHNKSWDMRRLGGKPPVVGIMTAVGSKERLPSNEKICNACHFTLVEGKAVHGVSCESCHGPASDWKEIHNLGQGNPAKHTAQLELARQKGMIHSSMKQELMQNCFGCHNYDNPDVNGDNIAKMLEAGHPSFNQFEFVAYSQGTIRHRFYPPDPTVNAEMSPEDLARWYVLGQGAELVSSTRVLKANASIDAVKTAQQAQIDTATKVLNLTELPEAKALIADPTDANLKKLIAACDGKNFTAKVGSMVPKEFK